MHPKEAGGSVAARLPDAGRGLGSNQARHNDKVPLCKRFGKHSIARFEPQRHSWS